MPSKQVKTLDFNVTSMSYDELHNLLQMRSPVWFQCTFFDEAEGEMITRKMYCSSPKYHKYYLDPVDFHKNIYTDVQFSFVEE